MRRQGRDEGRANAAETEDGAEPAEVSEAPQAPKAPPPLFSQTVVGWLTPESTVTSLVVDFVGNPSGPRVARSTVRLDEAALSRATATRQPAALVFENGDMKLPIVLGLLQVAPSPLQELLVQDSPPPAPAQALGAKPLEASVDGKRIVVTAEQEITLTCGEASLTLRRDGKILLRGAYVETYSRGVNRIKGAHVKIN